MDGRRQVARFKIINLRYFSYLFFKKLFDPDENSEISGKAKLTEKTVELLLNEIFTLDDKQNEIKMKKFTDDFDISIM